MNEDKLIEQMVQRLGAEVKKLLSQARQSQVATAAVERVPRDRLWHFGAQALWKIRASSWCSLISSVMGAAGHMRGLAECWP